MTLTKKYTCDKCGEIIPRCGVGYITDNSLVIITANIPDSESSVNNELHYHFCCYSEITKDSFDDD